MAARPDAQGIYYGTMKYLTTCVEQLDRAGVELQADHPIGDRISLILTDNIVELMIHAECKAVFSLHQHDEVKDNQASPYGQGAKSRVLGQHFDEKLKFLRKEGRLSDSEASFIRISHSIRNTAYHAGQLDENFLHPLAWEYHELACSLFPRIGPAYFSSSGSDKPPSARFTAHLPPQAASNRNVFPSSAADRAHLATSISMLRPALASQLNEALSDTLLLRIMEVRTDLEFLVQNDPGKEPADQILADALFSRKLFSEVPPAVEPGTAAFNDHIYAKQQALMQELPRTVQLPDGSWLKRAAAIRGVNRYTALERFDQITREMRPFAEALSAFASSLADHLDSQLDSYLENRGAR